MLDPGNKEIAIDYIMRYTGHWYKWGGDDPSGIDCSGLALEYGKAGGFLPRDFDTTAQGLWDLFKHQSVSHPYRGCYVFWSDNTKTKVIHVEIMLNNQLAIGASGGGSKTLTIEDAIRDNAFIKVRNINTRPYIYGYVDPWLKTI